MTKEQLDNIFKLNQTSQSGNNWDGTGFGMNIVQKLCDKLNIQIYMFSRLNEGTKSLLIIDMNDI